MLMLLAFLLLPNPKPTKAMVPFGGLLLYYTPPIVTLYVNCPPLAHIYNIGAGPTYLNLVVPPFQPKLYYNFYTPGVVVNGDYFPIPWFINCPYQPIFSPNYFGTSLSPSSLTPGALGGIGGGGRGLFEGGASGGAGGGDGY